MGKDADSIEGPAKQGFGKAKEEIGDAIGDDRMEGEGQAEQVEGKIQGAFGEAKETAGEVGDNIGDAADDVGDAAEDAVDDDSSSDEA